LTRQKQIIKNARKYARSDQLTEPLLTYWQDYQTVTEKMVPFTEFKDLVNHGEGYKNKVVSMTDYVDAKRKITPAMDLEVFFHRHVSDYVQEASTLEAFRN